MSFLTLPKMIFSSELGWPELEKMHLPLANFLSLLVLPMALLPPLMVYFAGRSYGDLIISGYGAKPWGLIAGVFLLAEVATVMLMGWMIQQVAQSQKLRLSAHDAFLLAGIAPLPLWLASLCLLVPNAAFDAEMSLLALAASCGLFYHGAYALAHMRDEIAAAGITQTVMGAGLVIWVLLLALIVAL